MKFIVSAQLEENYAFSEGGESWKNKGGIEFLMDIDFEFVMWSEETTREVLQEIIDKEYSNKAQRFTVLSIDMAMNRKELDSKVIMDRIKERLDQKAKALELS